MSRQQRSIWRNGRVHERAERLQDVFAGGRIWRRANTPLNERNEALLITYEATVNLMVDHSIPLRLLWQEGGIFDRVVSNASTSPRLSDPICSLILNSVQQMVDLMQRERDPTVGWIWPPDPTEYSDLRPFIGARNEVLGVNQAPPLTTRSHTVTWGQFGLDRNENGSNIRTDGRSRGNNRRPRHTGQRSLAPADQLRTPERRPTGASTAAPRRDRRALRLAPFRRQASPLLRQARPPTRQDPFRDEEPPAQRPRFRIPSPFDFDLPQPPTQAAEVIDLVEDEGMVEHGIPTNGFIEPGPSQPRVETRDSLVQRLLELQARCGQIREELEARRDPLREELQINLKEMEALNARLMHRLA